MGNSSVTYDDQGEIVGTTVTDRIVTVQYSRKMGRPNYGNEECGIFSQIAVTDSDDHDSVQQKIVAEMAFLKTLVHAQLGIESAQGKDGVVREAQADEPPAAPAAKKVSPAAKRPAAKPAGKANDAKVALWQEWVDAPSNFWDNRPEVTGKPKSNPRGPDLKHKESGQGLWIDDKTPAFARLVLDGEASAVDDEAF